ncbi:MAG: DNA-processing protein DprA [Patescibacteria group bacterium]|jgi:DNA processing protein
MTDHFLVALANCPAIGAKSVERLLAHFLTAEAAWHGDEDEIKTLGIGEERANGFLTFRRNTEPSGFVDILEKNEIRMITQADAEYPSLLKTISDAPFFLFLQGAPLKEPCISIVGSRDFSPYGKKCAQTFAKTLAANGISIISGLATGIDTISHQSAMEAGGHTVAVLGGGLLAYNGMDRENTAGKMRSSGSTLLTEFGLHSPFAKHHFPMRNRIIAGMSKITLVVEAALPSGSLLTADHALASGREVFAVPGPIDSKTSAGTNRLIKDGAMVATSPDDILLSLGISKRIYGDSIASEPKPPMVVKPPPELSGSLVLYACLAEGSLFADELSLKTKLTPSEVSQTLFELEVMGHVRNLGGTRYERV